ncbi:MAG TPA: hypothetical protein VML75_10900 [Kofleriaceae bacterium]|nr:hypothetical protein [Kofleriaceae bacterium]
MAGLHFLIIVVLVGGCGAEVRRGADEPRVGQMIDGAFLDDRVDGGELREYRVAAHSSLAAALEQGARRLRRTARAWCRPARDQLPACAQVEREIAVLEALARDTSSECLSHAAGLGDSSRWSRLCEPSPAPIGRRVMVIGASP